MDRRDFVTSLGALAGLAAAPALAGEPASGSSRAPLPDDHDRRTSRLFRYNGRFWEEIAWPDQRPGDTVLCLGFPEVESWKVAGYPRPAYGDWVCWSVEVEPASSARLFKTD